MDEDDAAALAERLITALEHIREDLPDLDYWYEAKDVLTRIATALELIARKMM